MWTATRTGVATAATPRWFGQFGQFGWLHVPDDGAARAGVVICPGIGSEAAWAHAGVRLLAEELEQRGIAVLRYDHPGTGHSAGDLKRAWAPGILQHGLRSACGLMRSVVDGPLALVGFRVGALVAARVAASAPSTTTAVALWDPCRSGRRFLREQRALRQLAMDGEQAVLDGQDDFGVSGWVLPEAGEEDLAALDLASAPPAPPWRTVVACPETSRAALRRHAPLAARADWVPTEGVDDMFASGVPPWRAVASLAGWLDDALPGAVEPCAPPPPGDSVTLVDGDRPAVRERVERVGPGALFAIASEPAEGPSSGPVDVILVNTFVEPCSGPARLWTETARLLAQRGRRVLRVDLGGLGDSPVPPGRERLIPLQAGAVLDTVEAARSANPADPAGVVLVGSCSGAYNALEAARLVGSRRVVAINPVLDAPLPPEDLDDIPAAGPPVRAVITSRRPWVHRLGQRPWAARLRTGLPPVGWRLLDALAVQRAPVRGLLPLVEAGTETLVVCGPHDLRQFEARAPWLVRRLERSGRFRLLGLGRLDHGLLLPGAQEAVQTLLVAELSSDAEPAMVVP